MKALPAFLLLLFSLLAACKGSHILKMVGVEEAQTMGDTVTQISNSCWGVFQANNGDYWFGSDTEGAYQYNGKTIIHYSTKDGLDNNRIRGIQEDKNGTIFITTLEGVQKMEDHRFTQIPIIQSNSQNENWRLNPDDLWFTVLGQNGGKGPLRYDGKSLYQLHFPKHYLEEEYFKAFPNRTWSPYDVYSIYQDHKGNRWFGTSNFGLCRYDGSSINWLYEEHHTLVPNGGSFGIRSMIEDSKGNYWFCNTKYRYSIFPESTVEKGCQMIHYEREKGMDASPFSDEANGIYFMSIVEDDKGTLWMATYNQGVFTYDGERMEHIPLLMNGEPITLFSIYKDRRGIIWLGTHKEGAYRWVDDQFEKFVL